MRFVFTVKINIIILRSYKLFSGLNILDSRLRGSDSNEGFVIPADAGGKRRLRSSFYFVIIVKKIQ